jgi:hypothetical protein
LDEAAVAKCRKLGFEEDEEERRTEEMEEEPTR